MDGLLSLLMLPYWQQFADFFKSKQFLRKFYVNSFSMRFPPRIQYTIMRFGKLLLMKRKFSELIPPGKYMFVEYSWNIPMIYSQNTRKKFPMKFRGIFPNNVSGILFVEYSWNIPMIYSQNIRKMLYMKFQRIFPNNVPGTLNIGVLPDCSMNIVQMLHMFFSVDQEIQQCIRLFLIFGECL